MRLRCQLCPSTDSLRFWQLTQSTLTLNPLPRRADRGRQNGFAAMIRPRLSVIAMEIGSGKPVVGATLVVARSRHQPGFIPLCGLCKAIVIPSVARNLKSITARLDSRGRFLINGEWPIVKYVPPSPVRGRVPAPYSIRRLGQG